MNPGNDNSTFPNAVYKRTVLAPLFEGAKAHYVEPVRAINQAHLVMLAETGIVDSASAHALARALRDIDQSIDTSALSYTGEFEDYFFVVEAELKKRLGPDTAGMLHTARSRNDMDHTIFKMVLKAHAEQMLAAALALASALLGKARLERDTLIVAYTHGQPAQPTTLGHYLCAALEVLLRDLDRLCDAHDNLDHCPMGAAAITTSGFPIERERVAQLLGFKEPLLNSYGCIASIDYITGWYSAIKLMFLHLGRLTQDMQFWTAFEVGQLYVPNSLVQISSIMPQKRNPVPIEHLRHLASVTCGRCDAIINTMHNTPFTDMNDSEGEVQQAGYAVYDSGERVLALLATLVQACSINEAKVAANTDAACITITELADMLVRHESLSFREAHSIAAQTASQVIAGGHTLGEGYDFFTESFFHATGRNSKLDRGAYADGVSARTFVNVRNRPGGPAPSAMDAAFDQYSTQLDAFSSRLFTAQEQQTSASTLLADAVQQLLEG